MSSEIELEHEVMGLITEHLHGLTPDVWTIIATRPAGEVAQIMLALISMVRTMAVMIHGSEQAAIEYVQAARLRRAAEETGE